MMSDKPQLPAFVEDALKPKPNRKLQPFEYYAAHWLVGSGITDGDLSGRVRSLAREFKRHYDIGVEHGRNVTDVQLSE